MRRCGSALAVAVAVISSLMVGGATSAAETSKYPPIPAGPITVGASAPLSGALAAYGDGTKIGLDLALQEFDAMHPNGIDGHPLKVDLMNDQSDVTNAVQVANAFVAGRVAAVVGESFNPAAGPQQLAVWAKAKLPVISYIYGLPAGTVKQLSTRYPYFFSPTPATDQYVTNAGKWIEAHHFTRVAFLNDGVEEDTIEQNQIIQGMHQERGKAKVVAQVTIPPSTVNAAVAVDKLKASGATLLVIPASAVSYGTIWQAIQAANWDPAILTTPGAWYSGFNAMGSLVSKAKVFFYACANSAAQKFTPEQSKLMAAYGAATAHQSINTLEFIPQYLVPLQILDYAVTKYHSDAPAAIRAAIDGMHHWSFLGFQYDFSPTNHYGLKGQFASAVCHMGPPYAAGSNDVPVKA